ncbi:fibronectin type III domain-containing protein [Persephonella sp.]
MKTVFKLILTGFLLYITSCGLKGGPLPPLSNKPSPVFDLHVKQQGENIILYWKYNGLYEDRRKMKNFKFTVYILDEKLNTDIFSYGNIYWIRYKIKDYSRELCFKIKVFNGKKFSNPSKNVCIHPEKQFPEHVKNIRVDLLEEGLQLKWENKEIQTRIYRGSKKAVPPVVYAVVKDKNSFLDKRLSYGVEYCYYLTSYNGIVESNSSEIVCKTYKDIFPPEPPKNPELIKKGEEYVIIWTDSPSKDVIGYILYKNGKPVINTPIKTYFFVDKSYKKGDWYYIIAVDRAGNKSKPVYLNIE